MESVRVRWIAPKSLARLSAAMTLLAVAALTMAGCATAARASGQPGKNLPPPAAEGQKAMQVGEKRVVVATPQPAMAQEKRDQNSSAAKDIVPVLSSNDQPAVDTPELTRATFAENAEPAGDNTPEPTRAKPSKITHQNDEGTAEPTEEQRTSVRKPADTVHPVEFRGSIGSLPDSNMVGTWQIGNYTVQVDGNTDLKLQLGEITAGAYVQVIGWQQSDGSVVAAKILVKKYEPGQSAAGSNDNKHADKGQVGEQPGQRGGRAAQEKPGRGPGPKQGNGPKAAHK